MTDHASFQGTYSDIKLIRSRKVAVVCIEIPIEAATAFVAAFGIPNPAEETWVALARMGSRQAPIKEKRPFSELPPAQQAALACKREAFQRYLFDEYGTIEVSEDSAANWVRRYCNVDSRSELTTNDEAATMWSIIYGNFQLWLGETEI